MFSDRNPILRRSLSRATFEQLRTLWRQIAASLGAEALLLTEDILKVGEIPSPPPALRFTVLVSERFSALLMAEDEAEDTEDVFPLLLSIGLSFDPGAIATFLNQLGASLANNAAMLNLLAQANGTLKPNDAQFQSEFTLSLVEILTKNDFSPLVNHALHQQLEQERLLNQVTTQIRQSLELPVILTAAVEQACNFLQADRLVIYQFEDPANISHSGNFPRRGRITYEARSSEQIPSVLDWTEEDNCFVKEDKYFEKYAQGFTLALDDVALSYIFSPCLSNLLHKAQVRAKIVLPILVQKKLWGLLIAHQCLAPRQWQESEKKFLKHIAEHLAIAIYQAQLYAQLQQQKDTLEQRVIEYTQELRDALIVAESASRTKSEFLAAMSHELRTPLTCVIGLSSTLLRWPFGELSQKQQNYLQIIHNSGEQLLETINDILELSQVEAGKTVLNLSEFSLSKMARQTLQMLREKADIRGVKLRAEINLSSAKRNPKEKGNRSYQPEKGFIADSRRIRQVLLNLLSNAVKFTPEGGRVTLRVWMENNHAVFQVEDTGIGIPEHQRSLLFQKFQQLDSSYNRQYEGTGLGLALTKQLVELHNGRIEVESTVGSGSTFTVWLPVQPVPTNINSIGLRSVNGNESLPIKPAGQVVLIEDREEVAILICDILTSASYQVVWLSETANAVEQIKLLEPRLAIVNLRLIGVDDYEVTHYLRHSSATRQIKVLALIADEVPEDWESDLVATIDDYLPQPIHPEKLLQKVLALASSNQN